MKLPRPLYIVLTFIGQVGSALSRLGNAVLFNGSTAQTISARAHIDGKTSKAWARGERLINLVVFWQAEHCRKAWEKEVAFARKVLAKLGV